MTTDAERDALLAELLELDALPPVQPGDITAADWAAAKDITRSAAHNQLARFVQAGVLTTHEAAGPHGGRMIRVWRRADKNVDT